MQAIQKARAELKAAMSSLEKLKQTEGKLLAKFIEE